MNLSILFIRSFKKYFKTIKLEYKRNKSSKHSTDSNMYDLNASNKLEFIKKIKKWLPLSLIKKKNRILNKNKDKLREIIQ